MIRIPVPGKRFDRTLERLRTYRPAQWICYTVLIIWSVYTIWRDPTSPIIRFMPGWVYSFCISIQLLAPLASFVGQLVQQQRPLYRRQKEAGWWLQAGADAAIWWTIGVTLTAFIQATDEPSALSIIGFLTAMLLASLSLVVRDIGEIINCRCRPRRREAPADEL